MLRLEHPRPDFYRKNWKSLNGKWQFEIADSNPKNQQAYLSGGDFATEITVPFVVGCPLSGVNVSACARSVWYKRNFDISPQQLNGSILLNFCAVDYRAEVYINGKFAAVNKGGYTGFTVEISAYCIAGSNTIVVNALDSDNDPTISSGLQNSADGGDCPAMSGIWQSVYLEFSECNHIVDCRPTALTDKKMIVLEGNLANTNADFFVVNIAYGGKVIANYKYKAQKHYILTAPIKEPINIWNVLDAKLYNIELQIIDKDNNVLDAINTYCGFRDICINNKKLVINNKGTEIRAICDAGFFKQGYYTAPSVAAIKQDIMNIISLGYNAVVPYNKIVEPLYLYYADVLGIMVIESYPTGGTNISLTATKKAIHQEWLKVLSRDYMHPCIVIWAPIFQDYSQNADIKHNLYIETKARDSHRLVADTLIGTHYDTDVFSLEIATDLHSEFINKVCEPTNGNYKNIKEEQKAYKKDSKLLTRERLAAAPLFVSLYGGFINSSEKEFLRKYEEFLTTILARGGAGYGYLMLTDCGERKCGIYDDDRNLKLSREALAEFRRINGLAYKN